MSARPTASDLPEGQVVGGRYRVVKPLGAGGVATVYEAENTWTRRRVALKVLDLDGGDDARAAQRFRVEAVAAARLAHPRVADVLDMGEDATLGALFLAQELLDGCDLRARLDASGPMSPREALDVAVPVAATLAFAHARGVIHRDIKPENLFLTRGLRGEPVVKVIDFGLALLRGPDAPSRLTEAGAALGTGYYMAPEQCRGDLDLDEGTDVWALGAVLFEMVTGAPPFDAPTYALLTHRILSEEAPRADRVAPEVPSALADVIAGALTRDRASRTPDMRALVAALLACPLPGDEDVGSALRARHRDVLDLVDLAPTTPPGGADGRAERARAETQPRRVTAAGRSWRLGAALAFATFALAGGWRLRDAPGVAARRASPPASPRAEAPPLTATSPAEPRRDLHAAQVADASPPVDPSAAVAAVAAPTPRAPPRIRRVVRPAMRQITAPRAAAAPVSGALVPLDEPSE